MNIAADSSLLNAVSADTLQANRAAMSQDPAILADLYQEHINIAVWQRELSAPLKQEIDSLLTSATSLQVTAVVTPDDVASQLSKQLPAALPLVELTDNITELVDLFCCLFEIENVGLRLTVLDRAMCPRFHVDKVPCRLVTTFQGSATQWLPHNVIDRSKLGAGNQGKPDNESGLYANEGDVQQLQAGDVAILKGENWVNNTNAGLVHRSPGLVPNERRLLLTLDFAQD